MKKVLAVLLIVSGLAIAVYPLLYSYYREYRVEQGLARFARLEGETYEVIEVNEDEVAPGEENGEEASEKKTVDFATDPVAVLSINSIDLELPVFRGTSKSALNYGAGLWEEGAGIGEKGSAVITAHRAHSYGSLFNRLDELKEGDRLVVETGINNYTYLVCCTGIFDAADFSYLDNSAQKKRLILYTCHPLYRPSPPYRLVVQAVME